MGNGIGRANFIAYNMKRGGKNFLGGETPPWNDLPEDIQEAWMDGAKAVLAYNAGVANWRDLVDPQFLPLIKFAEVYSTQYGDVPLIGRNMLLAIQKLVKILDGKHQDPTGGV